MEVKKNLIRYKKLSLIIALIVIIKIFSANTLNVERFYSTGFYSYFSKILRFIFGWIPFSVGDILYFLAGCWATWKLVKNIKLLFKKQLSGKMALQKFYQLVLIFGFIYIVFNVFWGMNYDREGIAYQLQLTQLQYDTTDLATMQNILLRKVNATRMAIGKEHISYPSKKELIVKAEQGYKEAQKKYPFLEYKNSSAKISMYGMPGDYLGFTGYYNPFTGEAQINTTVPEFLQPYIATHEIAHQLGYAKENEANFVGYLAAINSPDTLFHYSTYLDLFLYTNREVYYFDSTSSKNALDQLNPFVKSDLMELKQFDLQHRFFLEPLISWMYGNFLKLNNQPKGLHSYNAVVAMLIAYYKKYGKV
jgi:hypothetical protein